MISDLLEKDPAKRPSSEKLFLQFQDKLYQNMIISNDVEYGKIVNFLFSEQNIFLGKMESLAVHGKESNGKMN